MARNGVKTGGRVKGVSLNKKTVDVQDRADRVLTLIESDFLEDDIRKLSPNQRVMLYADMMEYKAPKLQRTTIVGDKVNPLRNEITINVISSNAPIAENEEDVV